MKDREKKQALAEVFGVVRRDGVLSGVPNIPGLRKKITCTDCDLKLWRGVPKEFAKYMSEAQKAEYRALMKRKR